MTAMKTAASCPPEAQEQVDPEVASASRRYLSERHKQDPANSSHAPDL
jgi:hypothetical protein